MICNLIRRPNTARMFMFKSTKAIRDEAGRLNVNVSPSCTVDKLIEELSSHVSGGRERQGGHGGQGRGGRNSTSSENSRIDAMKALLQRSFQKRLTGKSREQTSLGHKLEEPIFRSFMGGLNEDDEMPGLNVLSAYSAGLVAKKDRAWAKDSVDYIATIATETSVEPWVIEIKSRQKTSTGEILFMSFICLFVKL